MRRHMTAASAAEAVRLAEQLKASGVYDWFRGQARDWRPLRTSLGRLDQGGRSRAQTRLERFYDWTKTVAELASLSDDAVLAIAQHYGIPTNLIDFTTEPRIAGFFATYKPPDDMKPGERGCIICLNTRDLADLWSGLAKVKLDWPDPLGIKVDVPELWRLHAQHGGFLFLPYDEFERIYDFDRIYFPAVSEVYRIPEEDVFPRQQSDIEILLDQYFMIERGQVGTDWAREHLGDSMTWLHCAAPETGIEMECFAGAGLPVLASWSAINLQTWKEPAPEKWFEYSRAPRLEVELPAGDELQTHIAVLSRRFGGVLMDRPELRRGPVNWYYRSATSVTESLRLYWDGVRRWPYLDEDIAHGLAVVAVYAMLIEQTPAAQRFEMAHIQDATERCLGAAVELEISMADGSYTRGYAKRSSLTNAIRADLARYLKDTWQARIKSVEHVLQIVQVPARVFEFAPWTSIFVREIVPTQVVLRGQGSGKARLYNVARAQMVGLP